MSSSFPKRILLVLTSCDDPAREAEFNEWYNETHLPDLAKEHGLVNAARYHNDGLLTTKAKTLDFNQGVPFKMDLPRGRGASYLAVYEIDADDVEAKVEEILRGDFDRARRGRLSDSVKVFFAGTFERIRD